MSRFNELDQYSYGEFSADINTFGDPKVHGEIVARRIITALERAGKKIPPNARYLGLGAG